MQNPHEQLIETICTEILPNMVRICESNRMEGVLDQDHFVTIIEQKIERANKSLRMLPAEDQGRYRAMIDQAYAENIDRLRRRVPALPEHQRRGEYSVRMIPVDPETTKP